MVTETDLPGSQERRFAHHIVQLSAVRVASAATSAPEDARQAHYGRYPRLSRLRLNWLWISLHLGIAVYGIVLLIIACVVQ